MFRHTEITIEDMKTKSKKCQYDERDFPQINKNLYGFGVLGEKVLRKFDLVLPYSPDIIGNLNNKKHAYSI
jgi:hypothetical protein